MKKKFVHILKAKLTSAQLKQLRSIDSEARRFCRALMYPYARLLKNPYKLHKGRSRQRRNLEIGPGPQRISGFETVNVHWGRHVDYVADASRDLPFKEQTFDIIYASHVLEHIPWYQVSRVIKSWVRLLKSGGVLEIWVPNGYRIAKAFVEAEDGVSEDMHLDGWYRFNEERDACLWANGRIFSYGDGAGRRGDSNRHLSLFSPRYLGKIMDEAGLIKLQRMSLDELRGNDHGWINLAGGMRGQIERNEGQSVCDRRIKMRYDFHARYPRPTPSHLHVTS